jgi:hypothetical protein
MFINSGVTNESYLNGTLSLVTDLAWYHLPSCEGQRGLGRHSLRSYEGREVLRQRRNQVVNLGQDAEFTLAWAVAVWGRELRIFIPSL